MHYQGGKAKILHRFRRLVDEALEMTAGPLYEPFVGAFNLVPALCSQAPAICSDVHPGLAILFNACKAGWTPPENVTRLEYAMLKAARDWSNPLTTFAAFALSFGGKQFDTYARGTKTRNYASEAGRALVKRKIPSMGRCRFLSCDYREAPIDELGVIYCDPPYRGTTPYKGLEPFDSDTFDDWCRARAAEGHAVLVSEFEAPDDWRLIWETKRAVALGGTVRARRYDRLYLVPGSRFDDVFDRLEPFRQLELF